MSEKMPNKEYYQYKELIDQANSMPKSDAKEVLRKIKMELFKKYSLENEDVKTLIKRFDYSVD